MRTVLFLAVLAACSDEPGEVLPDGAMPMPDAPPGIDFFGEPCALSPHPEYPDAITTCRGMEGMCVDEDKNDRTGTCRPWCDVQEGQPRYVFIGAQAGGIVTWSQPGNGGVCWCSLP